MKKSALERAIDKIDSEIAVLQLARQELQDQQTAAPKRKRVKQAAASRDGSGVLQDGSMPERMR